MKLVVPTDFAILEAMSDGRRQTAPNLAAILGRERQYMNDRLADLAGKDLVHRVGPSDRSGMYEITERGRAVLDLADEYSHDEHRRFERLVADRVEDG